MGDDNSGLDQTNENINAQLAAADQQFTSDNSDVGTDSASSSSGVGLSDFLYYAGAIIVGAAVAFAVAVTLPITIPAAGIAALAVAGGVVGAGIYNEYKSGGSFTDGVKKLVNDLESAVDSTEQALAVLPWILLAGIGVYAYQRARKG